MKNDGLFPIPDLCPVCSSLLIEEGDFLFCRSSTCPNKISGSIKVWIKRLGILYWGDSLIDSLTDPDRQKVSSISDLYRLTVDEIAECSSGQKVAKKCHDVLHSNKNITVELLLASLNIPNLAISTATDIVQAGFDTIDKIINISYDDLLKVPNCGEITSRQIFYGIQERKDLIVDLASVLNISKPSLGVLSGKSFCITGSTSKPRKAVQKIILDFGGIVKESVGQGLNFLVTNESQDFSSGKMAKAKKLGTSIITEQELYSMCSI